MKTLQSVAEKAFERYGITESDIAEFSKMKTLSSDDRWNIAQKFYTDKFGVTKVKCSRPDITITFSNESEAKKFADTCAAGINKAANRYIINILHDDPVLYNRSFIVSTNYTNGLLVTITIQ